MCVVSSKLGVTKMVVIALVIIVVVGGIVAAYIALQPPSSSPTPTPTPSPTPSQTPKTHTVNWTTMANYQTDFWNITITNPYTIILNDSMTVSSGDQYLQIWAQNSSDFYSQCYVWEVVFLNSTYFEYSVNVLGGSNGTYGYLHCVNSIVTVVVNDASITFMGTSSFTTNMTFQNLGQIQTSNGDGNFNGGELNLDLH